MFPVSYEMWQHHEKFKKKAFRLSLVIPYVMIITVQNMKRQLPIADAYNENFYHSYLLSHLEQKWACPLKVSLECTSFFWKLLNYYWQSNLSWKIGWIEMPCSFAYNRIFYHSFLCNHILKKCNRIYYHSFLCNHI